VLKIEWIQASLLAVKINRRRFMQNSLVLASCAVIPGAIDHKPNSDPLARLISAYSHQCALNDAPWAEEDAQTMRYAYNRINPQNHLEYAVVTACAAQYVHEKGLIDENVRRKNGETPELFYHPVMDLEKRCIPNSYGLLFFRDQGICLLQELTDTIMSTAAAYWWELIKWKFNLDDFVKIVNDKYKEDLGTKGLQDMYNFIYAYSLFNPYSFHSTIVSRAGL
jgi:hypothetical protein